MIATGGATLGDRNDSTVTAVPPTLQGLLTQRLERLREHRDVVDVAAVLGRDFELATLAALVPLGGALASLAEHDVIRPVDGAPGRFEFTHALLQEAAYTRLLRQRRRALHRRVAELLTDRLAEREPSSSPTTGAAPAKPARSVPYWITAGEQAIGRAAFAEAADHFRRGLEALDRVRARGRRPRRAARPARRDAAGRGRVRGGRRRRRVRRGAAARRARARRLRRARAVGVPPAARRVRPRRASSPTSCWRSPSAPARPTGSPTPTARAVSSTSIAASSRWPARTSPRPPRTASRARRRTGCSQVGGDAGVAALAYNSTVLWNLGEVDESLACSDRSLELAERAGGPVTRAQAWGMRALLHLSRAEPIEFARWTERTRAHSVEHDVGYWRALAALLNGALRARTGELEAGRAIVDAALETYARSGSRLGLSRFARPAGRAEPRGGRPGRRVRRARGGRGARGGDRRALQRDRALPLQGPAAGSRARARPPRSSARSPSRASRAR